ncbi:uncharacterized protein LOC144328977 isoform X3 [Podarcis muralis]
MIQFGQSCSNGKIAFQNAEENILQRNFRRKRGPEMRQVLLYNQTVKTTAMKDPPFIAFSKKMILAWEAKLEANNEGVSKGGQCHGGYLTVPDDG